MAQPVTLGSEDTCENFKWILGTWESYSPWGDQTKPTGGTLVFTIGANGTLEGRIGRPNDYMKEVGYTAGMLVYRGHNEVRYYGPDGTAVYEAFNGEFLQVDRDAREWRRDSIGVRPSGFLYQSPPAFSHLAGPFRKASNARTTGTCVRTAKPSSPTPKAPDTPSLKNTEASQPGRHPAGHSAQADLSTPSSSKRCNYVAYQAQVGKPARLIIYQFEKDTDEVATYDPDMPFQRLFPSPISGAADIPVSYMDFADYRALTRMEEITNDVLVHSGPDKQLTDGANEIRRLLSEAQQSYDLSARLADQRRTQCPKFSDPDAYPKVADADAVMDSLRKRRDELLKPRLAEGERLNEKLTREFFSDLAEASSLDEKQKELLADLQSKVMRELKSRLTGEAIEPRKIENLVPQLEALRDRYSKRESEGKKVSQETRDKDLKEALKRSGIDYDPSLVRSAKRDGQISMGKAAFDYLFSTLGPQVTGFGRHLTTAQSYFAAAKVTAESLNALKNLYSLFGTRDQLMPVALTVQENRAYLTGLVRRYDALEQEYAIMRKNFEDAITSGGELSETD
ncbi:hypothetical protein ACXYL9_09205 [Qipengyuania sp. CAU 1752]